MKKTLTIIFYPENDTIGIKYLKILTQGIKEEYIQKVGKENVFIFSPKKKVLVFKNKESIEDIEYLKTLLQKKTLAVKNEIGAISRISPKFILLVHNQFYEDYQELRNIQNFPGLDRIDVIHIQKN